MAFILKNLFLRLKWDLENKLLGVFRQVNPTEGTKDQRGALDEALGVNDDLVYS